MASPLRRHSLNLGLLLLIVIMAAEMGVLVRQNRRLQAMLTQASPDLPLRPGQILPPVTASGLDGGEVTLRYEEGGPSTVLIWFSPSCHVCAENAAFWNEAYDRYKASPRLRFLALSDSNPGETRTYVSDQGLELPVASVADGSVIDAYNGRVLPQTALVSPTGLVLEAWPGALDRGRRIAIVAALDSLST
jgi:peroxiredoxin